MSAMGELERILPSELTDAALASGNELVLPYVEALRAIVVATRHQIAVLGLCYVLTSASEREFAGLKRCR